jgi:hypothetical protein
MVDEAHSGGKFRSFVDGAKNLLRRDQEKKPEQRSISTTPDILARGTRDMISDSRAHEISHFDFARRATDRLQHPQLPEDARNELNNRITEIGQIKDRLNNQKVTLPNEVQDILGLADNEVGLYDLYTQAVRTINELRSQATRSESSGGVKAADNLSSEAVRTYLDKKNKLSNFLSGSGDENQARRVMVTVLQDEARSEDDKATLSELFSLFRSTVEHPQLESTTLTWGELMPQELHAEFTLLFSDLLNPAVIGASEASQKPFLELRQIFLQGVDTISRAVTPFEAVNAQNPLVDALENKIASIKLRNQDIEQQKLIKHLESFHTKVQDLAFHVVESQVKKMPDDLSEAYSRSKAVVLTPELT